jgi:hypothetical protein
MQPPSKTYMGTLVKSALFPSHLWPHYVQIALLPTDFSEPVLMKIIMLLNWECQYMCDMKSFSTMVNMRM